MKVQVRNANAIVQCAKKALNSHNTNELLENEAAEKKSRHFMIVEDSVTFIEFKEAIVSKKEMHKP